MKKEMLEHLLDGMDDGLLEEVAARDLSNEMKKAKTEGTKRRQLRRTWFVAAAAALILAVTVPLVVVFANKAPEPETPVVAVTTEETKEDEKTPTTETTVETKETEVVPTETQVEPTPTETPIVTPTPVETETPIVTPTPEPTPTVDPTGSDVTETIEYPFDRGGDGYGLFFVFLKKKPVSIIRITEVNDSFTVSKVDTNGVTHDYVKARFEYVYTYVSEDDKKTHDFNKEGLLPVLKDCDYLHPGNLVYLSDGSVCPFVDGKLAAKILGYNDCELNAILNRFRSYPEELEEMKKDYREFRKEYPDLDLLEAIHDDIDTELLIKVFDFLEFPLYPEVMYEDIPKKNIEDGITLEELIHIIEWRNLYYDGIWAWHNGNWGMSSWYTGMHD